MIKGMVSIGNLLGRLLSQILPEEAIMKEMWEVATDEEKHDGFFSFKDRKKQIKKLTD